MAAVLARVLLTCKAEHLDAEIFSCQVFDQFAKKDKCSCRQTASDAREQRQTYSVQLKQMAFQAACMET